MRKTLKRCFDFIREHNLTGLVLILVLAGLGAFLLALLTEEVLESEFSALNTTVLVWFNSLQSSSLSDAAVRVTNLGSIFGVGFFAFIAAAVLIYLRQYDRLKTLAAVLLGGSLLGWLLKMLFHVDRPSLYSHIVAAQGFSFPSGHSTASFCFWGFLALLVAESDRRLVIKIVAITALLVVPISVALSRMYLQVHFLTDVMAGVLVAMFWVSACEAVRLLHHRNWRIRFEHALET